MNTEIKTLTKVVLVLVASSAMLYVGAMLALTIKGIVG